jgi:hypothetical protein
MSPVGQTKLVVVSVVTVDASKQVREERGDNPESISVTTFTSDCDDSETLTTPRKARTKLVAIRE